MKCKKKGKSILVASYYFPPEITPRAFRTYELVKELSKRGYNIDLFIPKINQNENYEHLKNISINFVDVLKYKTVIPNNEHKENKVNVRKKVLLRYIKKVFRFFVGEDFRLFYYSGKLYQKLIIDKSNKKYDFIISIGLPFYVHLAIARYIKNTNQQCVSVCDYGDPFYLNPVYKKFYLLKFLEKWVLKQFDYISIPNPKSINYYTDYKEKSRIKVIPQGFDTSNIKLETYKKNKIPTFCYAGIFYKDIRNPEFLFEFLSALEFDYRFIIYTRINDEFFQEIISKYREKFGDRIILRDFIPREELIKEMSKMDFLINLENENSNQMPSKVIDYALSNRPILSISKNSFHKDTIYEFLNGNYDEALKVNLEDYNIKNVADKFEKLMDTKTY
jgi:hypothetical protein